MEVLLAEQHFVAVEIMINDYWRLKNAK